LPAVGTQFLSKQVEVIAIDASQSPQSGALVRQSALASNHKPMHGYRRTETRAESVSGTINIGRSAQAEGGQGGLAMGTIPCIGGLLMLSAGAAQAQVELKTYADADGNIDVQKLTCAQLAGTF
jgi:hypothetical protein